MQVEGTVESILASLESRIGQIVLQFIASANLEHFEKNQFEVIQHWVGLVISHTKIFYNTINNLAY